MLVRLFWRVGPHAARKVSWSDDCPNITLRLYSRYRGDKQQHYVSHHPSLPHAEMARKQRYTIAGGALHLISRGCRQAGWEGEVLACPRDRACLPFPSPVMDLNSYCRAAAWRRSPRMRGRDGDADHEKGAAPPSIGENWPRTYA